MKTFFTTLAFCLFSFLLAAQNEAPNANTDGTLTVTANVGYSSPYYFAVWIKGTTGTFLRTITMYGQNSKYYKDLGHWNSESGANKVNAVTGATKSTASAYTSTWNGKDQANTTTVPDGNYTVSIEMSSESYGTNSKYITTTFTKGPAVVTLTPTAVSPISNVSIQWVPSSTAINNIELSKLYSVYPNPTRSTVYINGFDIEAIEVYALNGKLIFVTNNQKIDLSGLSKGIYLAKITTKAGTFMKKIEKL